MPRRRTDRGGASIRRLRTLSLVLAFMAATGLVLGTAGFSVAGADRALSIGIVDDEDAYLGFEELHEGDGPVELTDGEPKALVEYRNQVTENLTHLDVEVTAEAVGHGTPTASVEDAPDHLDVGQNGSVVVAVDFGGADEVELTFEANGTGDDVTVDKERTVTVVPETVEVDDVIYNGVGSAFIEPIGQDGAVEAIVWYASDGDDVVEPEMYTGDDRLDTSSPVSGSKIAAIEFPDQGIAFVHPQWDAGSHDQPNPGDHGNQGGNDDAPGIVITEEDDYGDDMAEFLREFSAFPE